MDQISRSDELDARPQPIVAIPFRWPRVFLLLALTIPLIFIVVGLCLDPAVGRQGRASGLGFWIMTFLPMIPMLILVVPMALFQLRAPEFAVFKEGIKVPIGRIPPMRSIWDPWSYGSYSWSEVGYCRWSPYKPGVISIHLQAAPHHGPALPGTGLEVTMQVPPMIYFYRVPERRRAEVESAIRTYGKWVD
jgi:hypothetical protein